MNLITINHDSDPENRSATYGRPIVIEDKVWIGINSTILPGVTVGYGSIVGANSVVTHDVSALYSGWWKPAKFIKEVRLKSRCKNVINYYEKENFIINFDCCYDSICFLQTGK